MKKKSTIKSTTMAQAPATMKTTKDDKCCLHCGKSNLSETLELPTVDYAGTLEDGRQYTSVEFTRIRCAECGRVSVLKSYPFDLNKWKE